MKFNAMAGRVVALEGQIESLAAQHRKLSGKFHAEKSERNAETPPSADVGLAPAELRMPASFTAWPICDNYDRGRREGPDSDAANCECGYCSEMRGRRAATKAALLPAARAATLATSRTRE